MELPFRQKGDERLRPGAMVAVRERLREHAKRHDLATVVAYCFDHRTRMLPFYFVDRRMAPGGVRAVGSALVDAGFEKSRIVLQTWNRRFEPSEMRIDGRIPDLFLVSSMLLHSEPMQRMIESVCRIDPAHRPLVVAGGPHMWYEPWRAFGVGPGATAGADVAVTGELFVFLDLLDRLLSDRGRDEPLRATFRRMARAGTLDDVPGLVYPGPEAADGAPPARLVDTGIQRLLADLDELPHPVHGLRILEPPSSLATLADRPLPADRVRKHSPILSIEMTYGCKFRCPYCPIPAFNQHQDRAKSPARIADEMKRLHEEYGIRDFFGTDDNFFNRKERTVGIAEELSRTQMSNGARLGKTVRWATEATVHDTLQMRDHLRLVRQAGCHALWLGVEDMTATLVKKGQSVSKTQEAFHLLSRNGIMPMPMLIHDDGQPLVSFGSARGLINQVQLLRNAGATTLQVLLLGPAPGSALYRETFKGLAYASVDGQPVEPRYYDGNHVVASLSKRPWIKQLDVLAAYAFFYNPLRFLKALVLPKNRRGHLADAALQLVGMSGWLRNAMRTPRWLYHLLRGRIVRHVAPPTSPIPLAGVDGGPAAHSLPEQREREGGTPEALPPRGTPGCAAPVESPPTRRGPREPALPALQARG